MTRGISQLALADGSAYHLVAGDDEAGRVAARLGAIMQLGPRNGSARPLVVLTNGAGTVPLPQSQAAPLVCKLGSTCSDNHGMFAIQVSKLALAVARDVQRRGGLLLHGALAERDGGGVILAGPGTVGKSTASRRLPPSWRSLSDDATLVVPDGAGRYWAHPWPTWSRFHTGEADGSWDVEHAVPLHGIFFLSQAPDDRAEPIAQPSQVVALLLESVQQVGGPMTHRLDETAVQDIHQERLAAVQALAQTVPAWWLQISLDGSFWAEIERVLVRAAQGKQPCAAGKQPRPAARVWPVDAPALQPAFSCPAALSPDVASLLADRSHHVLITGPSMIPTLREPDVLEVEPYAGRPVRRGDVICFNDPATHMLITHRVVAVRADGIRTRGDNNPQADPDPLLPGDIDGRVVAAWRGDRRRVIAGGWRGLLAAYAQRARRAAWRTCGGALHLAYRALAARGYWRVVLPARYRPRVVAFTDGHTGRYKLMMGQRSVGGYDAARQGWLIRRPYRFFLDEAMLPDVAALARQAFSRCYTPASADEPHRSGLWETTGAAR